VAVASAVPYASQLDHMQIIYTSLQTDNHTSTSPLTGRMPFLLPNQQHQSTEGKHNTLYK